MLYKNHKCHAVQGFLTRSFLVHNKCHECLLRGMAEALKIENTDNSWYRIEPPNRTVLKPDLLVVSGVIPST